MAIDKDNDNSNDNDKDKDKDNSVAIVAAVIAAAAVLSSAIFGYWSQDRISALDREQDNQELALETARLTEAQNERRDEIISAWLPGVLDEDSDTRQRSRSLLLILLPDQAESLFQKVVDSALPALDDPGGVVRDELRDAVEDASEAVEQAGQWVIVVGADESVAAALDERDRTSEAGFSDVEIVLRDEYFRTMLVGYDSRDSAEAALPTAQVLIREGSFVQSLGSWLEGDYAQVPNIYDHPRNDAELALDEAGFENVTVWEVASSSIESGQARELVLDNGAGAENEDEIVDETGVLVSHLPATTPLALKIAS